MCGSISCGFYNMADRQARELAEILQRAQSLAQRLGSAGVPVARTATTSAAVSSSTTLFATSSRQSSTHALAPNSSNPVRFDSATASRATKEQNSSSLGNYRRLLHCINDTIANAQIQEIQIPGAIPSERTKHGPTNFSACPV